MKKLVLLMFVALVISGCGVEWFPANTTTSTSPSLSMLLIPSTINIGTNSSLTFTIINGTGNPAQSGLGFTESLPANVSVATSLATQNTCGGTITASGSTISFSGGTLAVNATSCTIGVQITSTATGSYSLNPATISGLTGGLVNGSTAQTLTVTDTQSLAVGTGKVIATNFVATPSSLTADPVSFAFTFDVTNSDTALAAVTVFLQAVDGNGAPIPSTLWSVDCNVPGNTVAASPFNGADSLPGVALADVNKIKYWHIVSVVLR